MVEGVFGRMRSVVEGEMEGEQEMQTTCCAICFFMYLEISIQLEREHYNFHVGIVTRQK